MSILKYGTWTRVNFFPLVWNLLIKAGAEQTARQYLKEICIVCVKKIAFRISKFFDFLAFHKYQIFAFLS